MMRQKIFLLIVLLLMLFKGSNAQDKGFTILLGPSVNYYGDTEEKLSYSTEKLNWQFNGQLGYISTRGGTTRGNMLAVFGTGGNTNPGVLQQMQTGGANIIGTIDAEKNFNEFYSVEGGMVIARFLRISGGVGRQAYSNTLGENYKLKYFSGTLGFVFNLDAVNWVIDANVMTGKDLNQTALRISTGFMVKF
jgi:hypothetical protein